MNTYPKINLDTSNLSDNKYCNLFCVDATHALLDITGLISEAFSSLFRKMPFRDPKEHLSGSRIRLLLSVCIATRKALWRDVTE